MKRTPKRRRYRQAAGATSLVVAATIALSACGTPTTPHVASLGNGGNGTSSLGKGGDGTVGTTTTLPNSGNATALADRWATCERSHGDPNQTDPTIDEHGGIDIIIPLGFGSHQFGEDLHNATGQCSEYLAAAQRLLEAEFSYTPWVPDNALLVQYASCMRSNGVPNYPDPQGDESNLSDINTNSPTFLHANLVCGRQIHAPAWWINGWGPPGDISSSSAGLPQNGGPPPARAPAS